MKTFKQHRNDAGYPQASSIDDSDARGAFGENTNHPYKMTYHKVHSNGRDIDHHELHHMTHYLEGNPTTREGARGMVSRSHKHEELKKKGYKPHSVGEHDLDKHTMYGKPVKHTHES
jgi:hypothetical protein